MTRQLAHRAFTLATIARKGRKQPDDASAALSSPSARLLFGRAQSSAPAPAPDATLAQSSATPPQHIHQIAGIQSDSLPDASWRGFAAIAGVGTHGAGLCTSAGAQLKSPQHPFPVFAVSTSFPASGAGTRGDSSSPASQAPPSAFSGGAFSGGLHPATDPAAAPPRAAAVSPAFTRTSPTAATAASATAATATAAAPAASASLSSSANAGAYNEPKDGSFSGRIVQHDGSHAVHLLVSGHSARDYNLRMVRCHVRDELRFSPPQLPGGHSAGAAGTGCGTDAASARGEDVSFATFLYRQVRDTISATFLPAGYPDTTGQNYVRFMAWQGVHNVAMTANSVLASTFMLYAVGLGAGSIPTAGALNWVLKDGMGQLGTLLFGKTIAHNFDVHSKTWFFLSAVMLQAAAALELMTVLLPGHFLLMGSLANTLKGLAWMAAGSTRSVFHLSFARDNNIADVTAKGTSQYIFASLVGTAGGALMCAAVGQSGAAAATCFGLLAGATIGSAYLAVQAIPLSTLNATRLQLLVDAFLTSISPEEAADSRRRRHHGRRTHAGRDISRGDDDDDGDGSDRDDQDGGQRGYRAASAERRGGGAAAGARGGGGVGFSGPYDTGVDGDDDDDDVMPGGDGGSGGVRDGLRGHSGGGGVGSGGMAARGGRGGFGGVDWDRERERERERDASGGAMRRWSRPRAYRTVDRCYIGPSTHEYELMYDDSLDPQVPTPLELSPMDPPLPYFSRCAAERLSPPIIVGSRLEHVVDGNANLLVMLLTTYKYAHFMVVPRRGALHVVLHERADPRDMVQESLAAAERLTTIFMSTIEANGWTVAKVVVEAQRRRARW
ncbi:hypothetical protein PLESTB_001592600 [Pleodorina starrii]|uniref:Protein root UVB sensitive/RUS domain-containing protein n=1 Tax=Pleodorina starrii TaxID=330485 RepID=A0A9W6F8I9_9CHLO|nr:hypothetical protein PLESTB_001592600 [Pleodorina starrii]